MAFRMRDIEKHQILAFGGFHSALRSFVLIVESHQVQRAVDDVQQQFVVSRPGKVRGDTIGRLAADNDFAFQPIAVIFQGEGDGIGSPVMLQVVPVEFPDGCVIDDGDTDLTPTIAMILGDSLNRQLQAGGQVILERAGGLLIGDQDSKRHG